jgi:class 3 adenylate cyclase
MTSKGNEVNCIQAGEMVECIFGFCDIREFTATTECLRTDIMVFVNTCADIVHACAKEHRGFPNKNVGDAFLMVWRSALPRRACGLGPPALGTPRNASVVKDSC